MEHVEKAGPYVFKIKFFIAEITWYMKRTLVSSVQKLLEIETAAE